MPSFMKTAALSLLMTSTNAQNRDKIHDQECMSITDIACSTPGFSVLCEALHATKLDVALQQGEWTVFAPTDEAFQMLDADLLQNLRLHRDNLEYVILTHAIDGVTLFSNDLQCSTTWGMANEHESVTVECRRDGKYIVGAGNTFDNTPKITTPDIAACNGVVHVLDKVILPGDLPMHPDKPGYCPYCPVEAPTTKPPALPPTFAPTPAPPTNAPVPPPVMPPKQPYYPPKDPNPYKPPNPHTNLNYPNTNGIDTHYSPPKQPLPTQHCHSISDVICGADGFAVLCDALKITGLYTALQHNRHFTLFAPTDTAFFHLKGGYRMDFTKEEITALLLYHVIHDHYDAKEYDELPCDTWIPMASGEWSFTLCRNNDHQPYHEPPKPRKYQLGAGNSPQNEPEIILTSAAGSVCNGVIHVIDEVMLPTPELYEQYHSGNGYP